MSLKVSEFLDGNIVSKYGKLTDNELEIPHYKRKDVFLIIGCVSHSSLLY